MQTNKNISGRAIFSETQQIKERSIKLYAYLVCRANLRNKPDRAGDNVRIFQQKDINLSAIKKLFHMDERTIKRCWEGLELEGLIKFCPHDWQEIKTVEIEENDGSKKTVKVPFTERWKIRRKHKETYYEIPIRSREQLFRKIPKDTLTQLNERYNVNELTLKIYMTLINFQEECILNGHTYKKFTYWDLRGLLGYQKHDDIDKRMEDSLRVLQSLGLIEVEKEQFINEYGAKIPCFILNQANFYINFNIKDYSTGEYQAIPTEIYEKIKEDNKENYPEQFKENN